MSLGEKSQVSFLKVILEALLTKKYGGSSERGQTLQDFLFPWPQDSFIHIELLGLTWAGAKMENLLSSLSELRCPSHGWPHCDISGHVLPCFA